MHVLTIGQSGALTEATNSPFVVANPDFIAINPAGNVAYVPDSTDGNIFIFTLDANGQLTIIRLAVSGYYWDGKQRSPLSQSCIPTETSYSLPTRSL